jgi:tetratricopeptide (TPR) repeat protein
MPHDFRYRALLSYAHADMAAGRRLHRDLETFRIDADLAGRETPRGPVPKSLRPIFRDREDFSGGHTLTDATIAALIVLCSRIAATRPAVNEEVRLFRWRHPDRPVIPVFIDGTWPDNAPPALRYEIAPDGTITDRPVTILGPDLRDTGDSRRIGLAKIVAGMIGVGTDEIVKRAERARRRAAMVRTTVAASLVGLTVAGGYLAWRTTMQGVVIASNERIIADKEARERDIRAIVAREQAKRPGGAASAPGQEQDLAAAVRSLLEQADAGDEAAARIADLLRAGKTEEAIDVQVAAAEARERRADADRKRAAKDYREAAALARNATPARARDLYIRAATLDPEHVEGMYQAGWFQQEAGALTAAETAYRQTLATAKSGTDDRWIYWARLGLGDIQGARGDLGVALATYREAGALADRLAKANPNDAGWQRDLSVSNERVGDIALAQGDLAAALPHYRSSLDRMIPIRDRDPSNADLQRFTSVTLQKIGEVLVAQGKLAAALTAFRDSLAIAQKLGASDPGNAGWQRDLSVSYEKIGDVLVAQGKLPDALTAFRDSLAIAQKLGASDPGNAGWQRDLSVSYEKIGKVLVAQGARPDALQAFRDSLAIAQKLSASDPGNAGWQRDLSVSYIKIGDVLVAQGKLPDALQASRDSLAIAQKLGASDPGNAGWQRDLAVSYERIGDVLVAQGARPDALKAFRDSHAIRERLAQADPGNAGWQRDLSVSYEKIGNVLVAQGALPDALKAFRDSLAIRQKLAQADPGNAGWQRDLSVSYDWIGDVLVAQGALPDALTAFRDSLAIAETLAKADPSNAGWQRDLAASHWKLAAAGDEPRRRWTEVVRILRDMKTRGILAPPDERLLPMAEAELAKAAE